jgi:hypothetical protein
MPDLDARANRGYPGLADAVPRLWDYNTSAADMLRGERFAPSRIVRQQAV